MYILLYIVYIYKYIYIYSCFGQFNNSNNNNNKQLDSTDKGNCLMIEGGLFDYFCI